MKFKTLFPQDTQERQLLAGFQEYWSPNTSLSKSHARIELKPKVIHAVDAAVKIASQIKLQLEHRRKKHVPLNIANAFQVLDDEIASPIKIHIKDELTRELIHALFKNVKGVYVSGLSDDTVDSMIVRVRKLYAAASKDLPRQMKSSNIAIGETFTRLNSVWNKLQQLKCQETITNNVRRRVGRKELQSIEDNREEADAITIVNRMAMLQNALEKITMDMEDMLERQETYLEQYGVEHKADMEVDTGADREDKKKKLKPNSMILMKDQEAKVDVAPLQVQAVEERMDVGSVPVTPLAEEPKDEEVDEDSMSDNESVTTTTTTGPSASSSDVEEEDPVEEQSEEHQQEEEKLQQALAAIQAQVETLVPDLERLDADSHALSYDTLVRDAPRSLKAVEKQSYQCVGFVEQLMKLLFQLDSLDVGNHDQVRADRKKAVARIQGLLDRLDGMKGRFRGVLSKLQVVVEEQKKKEEVEAKIKKQQEEEAAKAKLLQEQQEAMIKAKQQAQQASPRRPPVKPQPQPQPQPQTEQDGTDSDSEQEEKPRQRFAHLWKRTTFTPEFESHTVPGGYLLTSRVPRVDESTLSISLSPAGDRLIVAGQRLPTEQDELDMLAHLRALYETGRYPQLATKAGLESALMRLGNGKFGTFKETFQLPRDAASGGIKASYDKGLLKISIPRIPRQDWFW